MIAVIGTQKAFNRFAFLMISRHTLLEVAVKIIILMTKKKFKYLHLKRKRLLCLKANLAFQGLSRLWKHNHSKNKKFSRKQTTCLNGHLNTWQSQPLVNGTAVANLLIPAAILFSGNIYKSINNFAEFINLQFVSSSHFYCIQKI